MVSVVLTASAAKTAGVTERRRFDRRTGSAWLCPLPTVTFSPSRRFTLVRAFVERSSPVDERLLIEAAQRDPSRFAELYDSHVNRVYAYIVRRIRDRSAAEDLTSEVFHHALANLHKYEWRGIAFSAWLYRIAYNAILNRWERERREAGEPGSEDPATGGMEEIERRAMLFELVDHLPGDQRRVITERFVEQKSIREVAAALGRSEGAVKQLQFRALETLREQMGGRANG